MIALITIIGTVKPRKEVKGFVQPYIIPDNVKDTERNRGIAGAFSTNKIRNDLFRRVGDNIQPSNDSLYKYRDYLTETYLKVLKMELDVTRRAYKSNGTRPQYSGIGYAKGNLKNNLKIISDLEVVLDKGKASFSVNYKLSPDFENEWWGRTLAEDRVPKQIHVHYLMKWVAVKMNNGTFRALRNRTAKERSKGDGDSGSKAKAIKNIAYAISNVAKRNPRPPVLKDWYKIDKNKRLANNFRIESKGKGYYYRSLIKKSIINQIQSKK